MVRYLFLLENTVQHYSWGSKKVIPELIGNDNPEHLPFAEMWMGAHPKAPSKVLTEEGATPLNELITGDPDFFLGDGVCRRFGNRLPFLFKVLAAEEPLSIQAHPDIEQAEKGYADEQARGIPPGAPERNYKDSNHKPELICALTPFTALCGFRKPEDILKNLTPLKSAAPFLHDLSDPSSCRDLFHRIMYLDESSKKEILSEVVFLARRMNDQASRWVLRLAEFYPEDLGVISPYILNLVELEPGQALSLKAGLLHSYLHGAGVELMANSDNVLRGGLTVKHIDRDELMKVLDFSPLEPPLMGGGGDTQGIVEYPAQTDEFALSSFRSRAPGVISVPRSGGPEILLCAEGEWSVRSGEQKMDLAMGQSLFTAAAAPACSVEGTGLLFRASVPVSD